MPRLLAPSRRSLQQRSGSKLDYNVLESRQLLANLSITDAFVSQSSVNPMPKTEVVGGLIRLSADLTTSGLHENAQYDLEFSVNGIKQQLNNLSDGAGMATSTFFATTNTSYHAPLGVSLIEIWVDPNNEIAESDESDNYYSFEFTSETPDLPMKFTWPIGGELFTENTINYYPDIDPSGSILDYLGNSGGISNNPTAVSLGPATNLGVDRGVPVFAAADGEVTYVRDGGPDRYTPGLSYPYDNRVRILHGGSQVWQTIYHNLRRDSILVEDGDMVTAGQQIGYVSSTVYRQAPQLSFTVIGNGTFIDTFVALDTYFETPPEYAFDNSVVTTSWVSNYDDPRNHAEDGISEFREFNQNSTTQPVVGGIFSGVFAATDIVFQWRNPDGEIYFEDTITTTYSRTKSFHNSSTALPADADLGEWSVDILIGGVLKKTETFNVVTELVPEIRIETAEQLIVANGRYSPYNLGAVNVGEVSPQMTFEVINHGTGPLSISDVQVPVGVVMTEGLAGEIAAGASDFMTFGLDPSITGYRLGQISIFSNDADESVYTFSIEGARVETGSSFSSPGHFTIGATDRSVREGKPIRMNIRVPESIMEIQEFDLSYDTSLFSGPTRVLIPNYWTQVSFELTPVNDFALNPDQKHLITATFDGPNAEVATYELFVNDFGLLSGTEGDDLIQIEIGESVSVDINGEVHDVPRSIGEFLIDGLGGEDELRITDSSGNEATRLRPGSLQMDGEFDISALSFETIRVTSGGGSDVVDFFGSDRRDTFVSDGDTDSLSSPETTSSSGFFNSVVNYSRTRAFPGLGNDRATIHDSNDNDSFYMNPGFTLVDTASRRIIVAEFEIVTLNSQYGGYDSVFMRATNGDNQLTASPTMATVLGDGIHFVAIDFEKVIVDLKEGNDFARLVGSEEHERFNASPDYGLMQSSDKVVRVVGAATVALSSDAGADDNVTLYDSPGDDTFFGTAEVASISNSANVFVQAVGFHRVAAISSTGFDKAILNGSEGKDSFIAHPTAAWLKGNGFFNHAVGFEQVFANSSSGDDIAIFFGSTGDDRFYGRKDTSNVSGEGFFNSANGFYRATAYLDQGGFDIGILEDSEDDDSFVGINQAAMIFGDEYFIYTQGLSRAVADRRHGGEDVLSKSLIEFELIELGDWKQG